MIISMNNNKKIINPGFLKKKYYINDNLYNKIINFRKSINNILKKKEKKTLIICGPCSIHDYKSTIEYAKKILEIYKKKEDLIFIVMRVYLEKPRSTIGWKGIINDPNINNTFNIEYGLKLSRKLLIDLLKLGIPTCTEILDTIKYKYYIDLLSLITIGARTTESQVHREIISSINIPTFFKNDTNGNIYSAINSIKSSKESHSFITINDNNELYILKTKGNNNCHLMLRGSIYKPNYYKNNIIIYNKILKDNNINSSIVIDCSHDNSKKKYKNQIKIIDYILKNKLFEYNIVGIMLESNLYEGKQNHENNKNLKYGISITDSCINIEDTKKIINKIYKFLKKNK